MSREFVILSPHPVEQEAFVDATVAVIDEGQAQEFVGGLTQLKLTDGREVISFWQSRQLEQHADADAMLGDDTSQFAYWTDISIPYIGTDAGIEIATAVAQGAGGRLAERT